jgi:hypothetical protein
MIDADVVQTPSLCPDIGEAHKAVKSEHISANLKAAELSPTLSEVQQAYVASFTQRSSDRPKRTTSRVKGDPATKSIRHEMSADFGQDMRRAITLDSSGAISSSPSRQSSYLGMAGKITF